MYVDVLFEKGNELETFALVFESTTFVLNLKKKTVGFLVPQILIVVSNFILTSLK